MSALLFVTRILVLLISGLPERTRRGLTGLLGRLLHALPWRKHHVIDANLALCFPEWTPAQRKAMHRHYCRELFRLVLEAGVLWHAPAERLK